MCRRSVGVISVLLTYKEVTLFWDIYGGQIGWAHSSVHYDVWKYEWSSLAGIII